jgi:23S rRNA (adenine2503-C2)-methyltransferase
MSPRRITLSTVGLLPALAKLAKEEVMPNLAISLHAPTDLQRGEPRSNQQEIWRRRHHRRLPPIPIEPAAAESHSSTCCSPASTIAAGCATLAKLVAGVKSKVNLIPLNAAAGIPFERPSDEAIDRFAKIVADHGVTCRCARAAAATSAPRAVS